MKTQNSFVRCPKRHALKISSHLNQNWAIYAWKTLKKKEKKRSSNCLKTVEIWKFCILGGSFNLYFLDAPVAQRAEALSQCSQGSRFESDKCQFLLVRPEKHVIFPGGQT